MERTIALGNTGSYPHPLPFLSHEVIFGIIKKKEHTQNSAHTQHHTHNHTTQTLNAKGALFYTCSLFLTGCDREPAMDLTRQHTSTATSTSKANMASPTEGNTLAAERKSRTRKLRQASPV